MNDEQVELKKSNPSLNELDGYVEVSNNIKKLAEGESIIGTFISIEESKSFPDSYAVCLIEDKTNEQVIIWANELLKSKLASIKEGEDVLIKFEGMLKNSKGIEYKNFRVFRKA